MKSFRISTSLSIFGLVLAMAGCSANASTDPASASQAQTQTQAQGTNEARPMHHAFFGPEHLLVVALHEDIGLSDAQKSTIRSALDATRPPAPAQGGEEKMKAHGAKLAAAVRAGKVDVATLATDAPGGPDANAMNAHLEAAKKALTTLHATLTPEQRQKLVAAVENHKGPGGPGGHMGHGGHHGGPRPEGEAQRGEHQRPEGMHGAFGLLKDLDLTDAQKEQIRTKLQANRPAAPSDADREAMKTKFEAMRAEHKARLESFAKDTFDANAFLAKPANAPEMGKGMKGMHEHMLQELATITEVLTPAQREKLAQKLEKGPEHKMPAAPAQQ